MISPTDNPDEKSLAQVLAVEIKAFKESMQEFKSYVKDGFDRLEVSFKEHQGLCREDWGEVFERLRTVESAISRLDPELLARLDDRLRKLEASAGRVNWHAVYALGVVVSVVLSLIALMSGSAHVGH